MTATVIKDRERLSFGLALSEESLCDLGRAGWLPTDIGDGYSVIRWIKANGQVPSGFFSAWAAKLRASIPPRPEIETDRSALRRAVQTLPVASPAGIVFHVSRCGSTLIANALACADKVLCLNEPPSFNHMLRLAMSPSTYWAKVATGTLRDLTTLFAYCYGSDPRQLVLKTGFGTITSLCAVRSIWPSVPCLFVVRNPVEVIVSNVDEPSRYLLRAYGDANVFSFIGRPPSDVTERGFAAFCAWSVGQIYAAAERQLDDRCLVVDHSEISENTVVQIAEHFGVRFP